MMQNSARFFIGFFSPILTSLMTSNCSRNLLFCRNFRSNFCQRTKPLIVVIKKFVSLGQRHYHPLLPQPFSCQQNNNLHFRSSNNRMENGREINLLFFSFFPIFSWRPPPHYYYFQDSLFPHQKNQQNNHDEMDSFSSRGSIWSMVSSVRVPTSFPLYSVFRKSLELDRK